MLAKLEKQVIIFLTLSMLIFTCLIYSCREETTSTGPVTNFTIIFLDDFITIDTNWFNTGAGIDTAYGIPKPSVECDTNASITSKFSFSTFSGLSISVNTLVLNTPGPGRGRIIVQDTSNNSSSLCQLLFERVTSDSVKLTCIIGSLAIATGFKRDDIFHKYTFKVGSDKKAEWFRNNSLLFFANNYQSSRLKATLTTEERGRKSVV